MQPAGMTEKQAEERKRVKERVDQVFGHIVACQIDAYLSRYGTETIQEEEGMSFLEASAVLARLRKMQREIDKNGGWQ